jgi:hypothetical protein
MEPTCTSPTPRNDLSAGMTRANNMDFNFNGNHYLMNREPDYYVYIHTVSEHSYTISRPPLISKMVLIGKGPKADCATCVRFPQPLLTPQSNVDSGEVTILPIDTRHFVMDIINPENMSLDQDAVINAFISKGNNLGAKGVFWSLNEVPTKVEIDAAIKRMEKYYTDITQNANAVEASAPGELPLTLTPEHHSAADYLTHHFGIQFKWHTAMSRLEDCELCGEKVKAGIAFHRTDEGGVCVRDWDRTVKSGARTRSQAYDATGDIKWLPQVVAPVAIQAAPKSNIPTEEKA